MTSTTTTDNSETDINAQNQYGQCALHMAARNIHTEKLKELLQNSELKIHAVDNNGKNALHHLVETPYPEFEEFKKCGLLLLEYGVDINVQDKMEETPLHKVFQCNVENDRYYIIPQMISFLLSNAKYVNHELKDLFGITIFHDMVSNLQDVALVSTKSEEMLECREKMIRNYLTGVIVPIPEDVIKRLLNKPDNRGHSAFFTYVDSYKYTIENVYMMVEMGADVNTSTYLGITPLMLSALLERDNILETLLRSGADVNKQDIFGQTAIFRARTDHAFDKLCEYGALLNVKDIFGRCPLANRAFYISSSFSEIGLTLQLNKHMKPPLALRFLKHGVDVNSRDRFGSTLLHYAAWYSAINMTKILLENGASKEIIDIQGYTPYDLADYFRSIEVLPLLENKNNSAEEYSDVEKQKRYARYSTCVIGDQNVDNMEQTLDKLGIKDDAVDLIETLLESPRKGLTDKQSEFVKIKQDIHSLMSRITTRVAELDERFQCTLFPTGSSSDGSQIGDPQEMDFVLCLDFFESQCEVIQTDDVLHKGFARLKISNYHDSHPLIGFTEKNEFVLSYLVRSRFTDLIVQVLSLKETWESENIYYDGSLFFPEDKPIITMEVEWYGAKAKSICISIDIVPAIHKSNWSPQDIDLTKMTIVSSRVKQEGFFLLFHQPERMSADLESSNNLLRISSAPIEIEILRTIPDIFRESFAISKILKSSHFCPRVLFPGAEDKLLMDDSDMSDDIHDEDDKSFSTLYGQGSKKEKQILTYKLTSTKHNVNSSKEKETQETDDVISLLDNVGNISSIYMPIGDKTKPRDMLFDNVTKDTPLFYSMKDVGVMDDDMKEILRVSGSIFSDVPFTMRDLHTASNIENQTTNSSIFGTNPLQLSSNVQNASDLNNLLKDGNCSGIKVDEVVEVIYQRLSNTDDNSQEDTIILYTNMKQDTSSTTEDNESEDSSTTEDNESEDSSISVSDLYVGGPVFQANEEISSYMLKNCLFYAISKIHDENVSNLSHLKVTKMIYETLLSKAQEMQLPAFIMPYIDIFSYVDTQIRLLPDDEANRELRKRCKRIESFCKVILGILSQTGGNNNEH